MASKDGEMALKVIPINYELQVMLDNLTHILYFISYDSEYVANKLMPKKNK